MFGVFMVVVLVVAALVFVLFKKEPKVETAVVADVKADEAKVVSEVKAVEADVKKL